LGNGEILKKIIYFYFGQWRDLGSLTYNSPLQEKRKRKRKKKDPMHELTQAHFWGPKLYF
jgi:hypothetical protein